MTAVKFDGRVSVGNIITAVVMCVGLIIGYQSTVGNVTANAKGVEVNSARLSSMEARLNQVIQEIQSDRLSQTAIMTEMRTDIKYLVKAVEDERRR